MTPEEFAALDDDDLNDAGLQLRDDEANGLCGLREVDDPDAVGAFYYPAPKSLAPGGPMIQVQVID